MKYKNIYFKQLSKLITVDSWLRSTNGVTATDWFQSNGIMREPDGLLRFTFIKQNN